MQELRQSIKQAIERQEWCNANALLGELWRLQPTAATAGFVNARRDALREHFPVTPCRLAILRSFTVEPVVPILRAAAFVNGIDLEVYVGEFNAYAQEILNPESALYRFTPDVVLLAAQSYDLDELRSWLRVFRSHSQASLLIHNVAAPADADQGILDAQEDAAVVELNAGLRRLAREHTGVFIVDYDALVARHGRIRWHDERKWLTVRMPVAADCHIHLAAEWLRYLHPLTGRVCKALVTDLDNTVWGGVLGEDGASGIQVGLEYPGAAYRALQAAMLDLHRRGILLAVSSKNDHAEAMDVLKNHSGMLLRPEHVSAARINWNDKAQSLREIAAELNIGLDALAFLDDNPAERARIRQELPEVTVIELPDDPLGYARALRSCPVFERLTLSREDRERGRYYAGQRERLELRDGAASLEDYYRSLEQRVGIARVTPETLARVAQLTRKTNQFNLTTKRYSDPQIAALAATQGWNVYSVQVWDRFGDNGITGVVITHLEGGVCEIDTFLLSCRVIGRTVESAVLAWLANECRVQGVNTLRGWFLPTSKNAPARDCYRTHRFDLVAEEDGCALWSLNPAERRIECPAWIRLETPNQQVFHERAAS